MRVSIFGLGYVGTVCAACLARFGHEVVGVDLNEDKNAQISAGRSPIVEPGLEELIGEAVEAGAARRPPPTTSGPSPASELSLICVGTPSRRERQPRHEPRRARRARRSAKRSAGREEPAHRGRPQHAAARVDARPRPAGARGGVRQALRRGDRARLQPGVPARGLRGGGLPRPALHARRRARRGQRPHGRRSSTRASTRRCTWSRSPRRRWPSTRPTRSTRPRSSSPTRSPASATRRVSTGAG